MHPLGMQKASFYDAKGYLLRAERLSFINRFAESRPFMAF